MIEHYQFITFRTHDSIDEFIRKWDFSPDISNKEISETVEKINKLRADIDKIIKEIEA